MTTNAKTTKDSFSSFDVVSDHSDHYYASPQPKDCFSNSKSRVHKHVMKEWKILEGSLPDSIFVRVYEGRIDLMRAVVVGAAGTPYHDGLFFFDIALPSDYPSSPPNVIYRSFGIALNPNLYPSGRVCLSLLNTWSGDKNEKWNPKRSTLLQVLISIQGLVLNDHPFLNEPGREAFPRFDSRSRAYNEQVFALTCQSAIRLIRTPPMNFAEFIKAHFCERAVKILTACGAYANGRVRVGFYGCSEDSSDYTGSRSVSFNSSIQNLYPDMVQMFRSCGAVLDASLEVLVLEEQTQVENEQPDTFVLLEEEQEPIQVMDYDDEQKSNKTKGGIFKKAVAKIKKVFQWKNSSAQKRIVNRYD